MPEAPRPVVWITYKDEDCGACGKIVERGGCIVMDRANGIRCLACEGVDGPEFPGAGDAAVTRRALARSSRSAIGVRFSRARHRNERQGVLVEEAAIDAAARDIDKRKRPARRGEGGRLLGGVRGKIRQSFPGVPPSAARAEVRETIEAISDRWRGA